MSILCPHKQNPVACWTCYQAKVAAPLVVPGQPQVVRGVPGENLPINPLARQPMPTNVVPAPQGRQEHAPREESMKPKIVSQEATARAAEIEVTKGNTEVLQPWLPDANGVLQPPPKRAEVFDRVARRDDAR
jgi:hypothetical protein